MKRCSRGLVALAVSLLILTGCGTNGGAGGFVAGNGIITWLAPAQRHQVGQISGTLLSGQHFDLSSLRGKVVVINIWGSWCVPCRSEAPSLAAAARQWTSSSTSEVAFIGINTRDSSQDNARAFIDSFKIPYPSLYDPDGSSLLAFGGQITPTAIPSTIILDQQGRIAASVIGELTSSVTLDDLIQDVISGKAASPS